MSAIYLSAAHKSSGKTTLAIGLVRAFTERGIALQSFKKGPDYIDPLWLSAASGKACYNLDFYTQSREEILKSYTSYLAGKEMALIEGNKGLFDGVDIEGSNSNAAMAAFLNVPIILVINCRGMTRGIAPLLLGYQAFDQEIEIAGVILNQVGGNRHQSKLVQVVEHYTDIPVLGAIQADKKLQIDERHLGLIPSNESELSEQIIVQLAETVRQNIDLEKVIEIAGRSPLPIATSTQKSQYSPLPIRLKIAIARDQAFGFYYPDDLDKFRELGVELVEIDTLIDQKLPEIDGLFLGGGFPETAMEALELNHSLRQAIADYIEQDGPVYAECGGLIYLTRSLTWGGKKCRMVGVIPADTQMHDKPQGRGYVRLRDRGLGPWPMLGGGTSQKVIHAHEFHYSSLTALTCDESNFVYEVERGTGIDGKYDGYAYKNLLASYTHMRSVGGNNWVERFVAQVCACKQR
ncbi:MAG: hydrogenobyrinic acid a,c-diamide synthase (glutamine-hydrolyzing) [Candidatus Thiodiazotropha sp. (ex Lucinoma annulata)]|nr:hydrogenobyrinic acid a,c-diamide synthase (glutamine-hydrolyzing) [Candidatus Thiodiazotropha sp. (ex Lucinoma annulata)]